MEAANEHSNVTPSVDEVSRFEDEPVGTEAYSMTAFNKMNQFRKRGQLCDVAIKVGGREFLAHRVVLAATSDYFDAMFSNGMAESAQREIELKSISPDIMDALLDYVYTGQVHVTMENVQDLLPAASLVQMEGVKTACSNFLLAEVDASNVLGIRRFAELHSCTDLEDFARDYAAHNFELVMDYDEFLCLNHEELLDLISREDLRVDCEETVYRSVIRWVYQQAVERSPHLPALLSRIRLPVMSVRFLTDVVDKDSLIRQSLECRDLVDDAKLFHLRPDLRHEMGERRYRQRNGGDEYLVVIGGFGSDQNPSDSVEMFNPRTLEWSELPDLPISYRYVAACSLDTCVYVIGGFDGRERLNTVCLLDIAQREDGWRWLTPMHYKRGLSAACTHKGLIYVCGGFDGQSRLRSLEVYHPKIDEWRILEDMTTAREGAGLVVVDDTLYCLGGYDGFHLLNSMEAFDIRRGSWSVCKPMYMRRSGAGCALLGDTIYVCGGYGGAEGRGPLHLDTVEAYNTRLQQWTLVSSMNVPRCYVGGCALAGKIYVAAGYNGSRLLDTVESYDPIENLWWLHNDSRMNHERCDTGMCVVRFLSCADPRTSMASTANTKMTTTSTGQSSRTLQQQQQAHPTSSSLPSASSTGQAMGIRPPMEISYRVPMLLPAVTTTAAAAALTAISTSQLRPGLSNLVRLTASTSSTGTPARPMLSDNNMAVAQTHSSRIVVPSVTLSGQMQSISRVTGQHRALPLASARHPRLPGSQFAVLGGDNHGLPPGFMPVQMETDRTQSPVQTSSSGALEPSHQLTPWPQVSWGHGCRWSSEASAASNMPTILSHVTAMGTVPDVAAIHASGSVERSDSPEVVSLDGEEGEHSEFLQPDPTGELTYDPLVPSVSSTSNRHRLIGDRIVDHLGTMTTITTARGSSSSSPTRMYNSAPEYGTVRHRQPDWFRSAEALNSDPTDYVLWSDRAAPLSMNNTSVFCSRSIGHTHAQSSSHGRPLTSNIPNPSTSAQRNAADRNQDIDRFRDDVNPTASSPSSSHVFPSHPDTQLGLTSVETVGLSDLFSSLLFDPGCRTPKEQTSSQSMTSEAPDKGDLSSASKSAFRSVCALGTERTRVQPYDANANRPRAKVLDPHWPRRYSADGRRRRPHMGMPDSVGGAGSQGRPLADVSTTAVWEPESSMGDCIRNVLTSEQNSPAPLGVSDMGDCSTADSHLDPDYTPNVVSIDPMGHESTEQQQQQPSSMDSSHPPGMHPPQVTFITSTMDPTLTESVHSDARSDGEGEEGDGSVLSLPTPDPASGQAGS